MSTQTENGRAFEWAVGCALQTRTSVPIDTKNVFSKIAEAAFCGLSERKRTVLGIAANIATQHILEKEAHFVESNGSGSISFNSDHSGSGGDVRDVILAVNGKTLGISCKNNHSALKHSRLSGSVDFVRKWGIDSSGCSKEYWSEIRPLFNELRTIRKESKRTCLWSDLEEKPKRFYWPILDAWAAELNRIRNENEEKEESLCRAIFSYLVGKHDFYKVICEESKTVHIQAWNFNRTLSTHATKHPKCINAINNKNGGQYSKTLVFNHGYSLNFRIHSASSRVEPSLKFDVNALGLPQKEIYQHTMVLPKT